MQGENHGSRGQLNQPKGRSLAKHLTRTYLHRVESLAKGGGVGATRLQKQPVATRDSLQSPAFGSRRRARGASRLGSPTPDSSLCLIYDPRGETKFPCPPQTAQTNETDALFIIAGAKTRSESRGSGLKKKKALKNSKGERVGGGGDFFSLPAVLPLVDPVAHSKHNISRDKRPWKRTLVM